MKEKYVHTRVHMFGSLILKKWSYLSVNAFKNAINDWQPINCYAYADWPFKKYVRDVGVL